MKRIWIILVAACAALFLLTSYLAIYYAPLPLTGVGSADDILPTLEGSTLNVAGFVSKIYGNSSDSMRFEIADFVDYQSWVTGNAPNWWTIQPIDVSVKLSGVFPPLSSGTNISVKGTVIAETSGEFPNSSHIGFSLQVSSRANVEIGQSAGQFGLMTAPVAQKIFYFHMPAAWVSYVSFAVVLGAGVLYLRKRNPIFDLIGSGAVEIGILFASIALLTGPIWAREEWGVYWRWDDTKLVTTFILWLVYVGYISLRTAISDELTKARVCAVYGIIGFVTVPASLLSSRIAPLLSSSHPQVIASSTGSLSTEAGITVMVSIAAFTLLFIVMLMKRIEIADEENEVEELKRGVGGEN